MIRFENIRKEYEDATPLKNVNAIIEDGEVVTIIGPSGTGKSTLLRMVNGLNKPTSGKIYYNDICITDPNCNFELLRQDIGMIFQHFNLFNHLDVLHNLIIPQMDILKISKEEASKKAMDILTTLGLGKQYDRMPSQLSGGQKQRVAIARCLVMDPKVILLDEPTSALDPTMVNEVENTIKMLDDGKRIIIIVTHDMRFAENVSDRIFYMDEGEVHEDGTPDQIFHHPKRHKTKAFVENAKILEISIINGAIDPYKMKETFEAFAKSQHLDTTMRYGIDTIFEELIVQEILNHNSGCSVNATIYLDSKTGKLFYKIKFSGQRYNPLESNTIAMNSILAMIENSSFRYLKGSALPNSIKFNQK